MRLRKLVALALLAIAAPAFASSLWLAPTGNCNGIGVPTITQYVIGYSQHSRTEVGFPAARENGCDDFGPTSRSSRSSKRIWAPGCSNCCAEWLS